MMKLVGILKSRGYTSGQIMSSKSVNGVHSLMGSAGFATAAQNVVTRDRIYAPYLVYKGKAALSAEPIPPKFTKINSSIRVKRQGIIMLTFSPSIGERKYDWEKKQHFALSAAEVGSLLSLPPTGSCEFFHDPAIKTSNAGQVRKSLSIKGHADGSGYFFSLSVANNLTKTNERFTVPVTSAEFAVMRTSFSFALPYIMGWDRIANQQPAMEESFARSAGPVKAAPSRLDSEWDR